MDFLIHGQISSFCPDQHGGKLLTLIMLHKLTQSLENFKKIPKACQYQEQGQFLHCQCPRSKLSKFRILPYSEIEWVFVALLGLKTFPHAVRAKMKISVHILRSPWHSAQPKNHETHGATFLITGFIVRLLYSLQTWLWLICLCFFVS